MTWHAKLKHAVRERFGTHYNAAIVLGVSQCALSQWCRGAVAPSAANYDILLAAFGDLGIPAKGGGAGLDAHLADLRIEEIVRQNNGLAPQAHTLEAVAGEHLARERVSQIEATAMAKIAKLLNPEELRDLLGLGEDDDAEQLQADIIAVDCGARDYRADLNAIRALGWNARREAI